MPPVDSTLKPKLKAPAGTCDTHMHIYDRKYPKASTAKIDAPAAAGLGLPEDVRASWHRANRRRAAFDLWQGQPLHAGGGR